MSDEKRINQFEFKAEIKQLLDILVHSLYTNKEIFLRELISNSSDALDKLRFEMNRGSEICDKDLPSEIRISYDNKNDKIFVSDTGIGMTKEELITNIGTIAKSGSAEFLKRVSENAGDNKENIINLIGKFGVGFYSVFMVAKEVHIKTKSFIPGEPALEWVSDGLGSYTIEEIDEPLKRGTTIEIYLREDAKEYADKDRLISIIKKHSNFISYPIYVENEYVNTTPALWREPKFSIKKEQYDDFYKFYTHDTDEPLTYLHLSVDAPIQFNSIVFIPKKNYDIFTIRRENYGLDLYVRRVLIQHKFKDLLPEYLSFVEGVVDSEDIPLNISRETLQENTIIRKIAQNIKNQILEHLSKLATEDKEKYNQFWKEHSKYFKFGYTDYSIHDKFAELVRFNSSADSDENGLTSFADYVSRMKIDQKEIYYLSGVNRHAVELNPHLELFKKKGIEVFYLYDPVDELLFDTLRKYKDYDLKSVENADFSKIEKFEDVKETEKKVEALTRDEEKELAKLVLKIKDILGDRITKVEVSKRLTDSPCCLVNPDGTFSSAIQKMLQIINKDTSIPKKVFEINKDHKIIRNLLKIYSKNNEAQIINTIIEQLYESALLLDGYLPDPNNLVIRMNRILENTTEWYPEK